MSYRLVIAEKPSVAQSIAKVLKAKSRKDGYLEGNGYLVSWCVGHLVGLADAKDYDEKYEKWNLPDLPILPDSWKLVVSPGKTKQFKIVKDLMNHSDVAVIVCATDAGREGELIFRNVYYHANCKKPFVRLWISSMEDSAIAEGFRNLQPSQTYDNLYASALARSQADWLVGINGTRLYTCHYHTLLRVGRVQTPVLAMLAERSEQIDHFKKTPYWNVDITADGLTVSQEKIMNRQEAEELAAKCQGQDLQIKSIEKQRKSTAPPRLYDLTTLQRDANRYFGYTAQQTLDTVQSLYERKLCTYPRTDSQYLTEDMRDTTLHLIHTVCQVLPFSTSMQEAQTDVNRCINNKKVSDHHALLPTQEIYTADLSALADRERNILLLISMRLLCAVAPSHVYEDHIITAECAKEEFVSKGKAIVNNGWKQIEESFRQTVKIPSERSNGKEKISDIIPDLTEGQLFHNPTAELSTHYTTPPKPYTEDTLLSAMENAGRDEFDKDTEKKGLGTPATRAGIIETLVSSDYVKRKGKNLLPTEEGIHLVSILPDKLKSPSLTAEWENALMKIEKGELIPETFMREIIQMVKNLIATTPSPTSEQLQLFSSSGKDAIGTCPWCGSEVYDGKSSYYCSNRECSFCLWKNNKFLESLKQPMTKKLAQGLIKNGRIHCKKLYSKRTGKIFEADLVLTKATDKDGKTFTRFQLEFMK